MATRKSSFNSDNPQKSDWKGELEQVDYPERSHTPNIHLLRKPAWYLKKVSLGVERVEYEPVKYYALEKEDYTPLQDIEPVEYQRLDVAGSVWKTMFSIPVLLLLALPLLAVLSLTLFHFGALPEAITPHMFGTAGGTGQTYALAGCWALALVSFVPWSATVCRLEGALMKYLG